MFDVLSTVLTVGGVAGIIAVIITMAICGRYLKKGPEPIPEVLAAALTTIIGFYFGTTVASKQLPSPPATPPAVQTQK
jgi:hypothetical protein